MPSDPATASAADGRPSLRGRPAVTSHAAIEQAAFRLFAERGFEATTLADIAAEAGVGQRTLTRYFPSKNDIPWGQFDRTLADFRRVLAGMPRDQPLWERVHRGVVTFNSFDADAQPPHRERMQLILRTPALQAHSVLRYAQWRHVIAEYVADQTSSHPADPLPRLVGHVSLALAINAYERWLEANLVSVEETDSAALLRLIDDSMHDLRKFLERDPSPPAPAAP